MRSILNNEGMKAATSLDESSRISYDLARERAISMREGMARVLPLEPTTEAQAEASAQKQHWKAARGVGMDGLIQNSV